MEQTRQALLLVLVEFINSFPAEAQLIGLMLFG
jgi:hypothetical protein